MPPEAIHSGFWLLASGFFSEPRMPRISGVDIPPDKKIKISLRYIYGVGPANALTILKEAGIDPERRAKELSEDELAKIIGILDKDVLVEGALRRSIQQN